MKIFELLEPMLVKPYNIHAGICSNLLFAVRKYEQETWLDMSWSFTHSKLIQAFKDWPEYSGQEDYPIRDPKRRYAPRNAFCVYDAWGKSAYADKRRELLVYLINWFKERDL